MRTSPVSTTQLVGVRLSNVSIQEALAEIMGWALNGESRCVCVANVHAIMEAYDDPGFRGVLNSADLVVADGMPLVWMMRLMGRASQGRVYGPELMRRTLGEAAMQDVAVGLFGSTEIVVRRLVERIGSEYPGLRVVIEESPPLLGGRPQPDREASARISNSGARILFVGLGCPKQERWMAAHRGELNCVMIGVGAAFDFLAGAKPQAPRWIQASGLEWLFRLTHEPGRLWKRYLYHNPRFVALALAELAHLRRI